MRYEPHDTFEANPGSKVLDCKENCPSPIGGCARMPKRKRRASNGGGAEAKERSGNAAESPAAESDGVVEPRVTDVLFGRGDNINRHPGNKTFRDLVEKQKKVYLSSQFKREKRMIADSIVTGIRSLIPPGRFLKKTSKTGKWISVDDSLCREKTLQALREKSKHYRAQLDSEISASKSEDSGQQDASSADGRAGSDHQQQLPPDSRHAQPPHPYYPPPPSYPGYMYPPPYYHGAYPSHPGSYPPPHPAGAQHHPHASYPHQDASYHAATMPVHAEAAVNNAPEDMDSSEADHITDNDPPALDQHGVRRAPPPAFGAPLFAPPPLQYNPGLHQQRQQQAEVEPRRDDGATAAHRQAHQHDEDDSPDRIMVNTGDPARIAAYLESGVGTPRGPATPSRAAFLDVSPGSIGSFFRTSPPDTRMPFSYSQYYNSLSPSQAIPLHLNTNLSPRSPPEKLQPRGMPQPHPAHHQANWYQHPAAAAATGTSPLHAPPPRQLAMGPSDYANSMRNPTSIGFNLMHLHPSAGAGEEKSPTVYGQHSFRDGLSYSPVRRGEDAPVERREAPSSTQSLPPRQQFQPGQPSERSLDNYVASPGLLHLFAAGHAAANTSPHPTTRRIPLPGATLSPRIQRTGIDGLRGPGEERYLAPSESQQIDENNTLFQRYGR